MLGHLSDQELIRLLVRWNRSGFEATSMVVRRGDDSSTWNQAAQAWGTARAHWFALMTELGQEESWTASARARSRGRWRPTWPPGTAGAAAGCTPTRTCGRICRGPGRSCGARRNARARWWRLPAPGTVWIRSRAAGPRPARRRRPVRFQRTPELVHGVAVADPLMASAMRSAGVFSGRDKRAAAEEWP